MEKNARKIYLWEQIAAYAFVSREFLESVILYLLEFSVIIGQFLSSLDRILVVRRILLNTALTDWCKSDDFNVDNMTILLSSSGYLLTINLRLNDFVGTVIYSVQLNPIQSCIFNSVFTPPKFSSTPVPICSELIHCKYVCKHLLQRSDLEFLHIWKVMKWTVRCKGYRCRWCIKMKDSLDSDTAPHPLFPLILYSYR